MNTIKIAKTTINHKFETIQLLRFFAFLIVVICHATFYTAERLKKGFYLYQSGYNGVALFFVISGFVMIVSSQKLVDKKDGWSIFSIRRIIRIVPVYWLLTTYKLILMLALPGLIIHSRLSALTVLKSYFFIPALNLDGVLFPIVGVGWTLNMEMFFYLLFAIALVVKIKPVIFLGFVLIPLFILSFYAQDSWPDCTLYAQPIIINFMLGVFAASLILNNIKLPKKLAFFILFVSLLALVIPNEYILPSLHNNQLTYKMIIFLVSLLIVYSSTSIEKQIHFSPPAWLVFLGGASYSLYLLHPMIAPIAPAILNILGMPLPWLSVICAIGIAITGGSLFFLYCEMPITAFFVRHARKSNLI